MSSFTCEQRQIAEKAFSEYQLLNAKRNKTRVIDIESQRTGRITNYEPDAAEIEITWHNGAVITYHQNKVLPDGDCFIFGKRAA